MKIHFPKLAKDSFLVLLSNGINLITAGLWGVLLARWLGKEYFGIYGYWVGFFSIVATICQFGLPGFLSRELSNPDEIVKKRTFSFYFSSQVIINSLVIIVLSWYIINIEKSVDRINLAVSTLIIVFAENVSTTISSWFFGKQKAPFVALISVIRSALILGTGIIAFYLKVSNYFLLYIPAGYSLIRFMLYVYLIIKDANYKIQELLVIRISRDNIKYFFKSTWSFGLMSIIASFNLNSDPLILRKLGFPDTEFGGINAANRLRSILGITGGAILNVILPKLSKDFFFSSEKFTKAFIRILKPLLISNLIISSLAVIFSEKMILILYGEQYRMSIPYMFLFSIGSLGTILTFLSSAIIAINKQKFNLIFSTIVYLIYPTIKFLMIPKFGSIVIAWIEAIGPWISMLIFLLYINSHLKPRMEWGLIIKIVVIISAVMIMSIVCVKIKMNPFISAAIILALIGFLSLKFSFINKELIKIISTN